MDHAAALPLTWALFFLLIGLATYGPGLYVCNVYRSKLFGALTPSTLGQRLRLLVVRRSAAAAVAASLLVVGWFFFTAAGFFLLIAAWVWGIGLGS